MERLLIFANPIAGRGHGAAVARRIESAARDAGVAADVVLDPAGDVGDDRLGTLLAGCSAVVSIGGDGTLRGVCHRLLRGRAADAVPPICVVSFGTANLMAAHLKLRWTDATLGPDVVAACSAGHVRAVDVGEANGHVCLLVAGVGLDGTVVHTLDAVRRGPISKLTYVRPILAALTFYDFPALSVRVDGRLLIDREPALVFVGNVAEYGTGFPILSRAVSDDGLLDVCVLPCRKKADLIRWAVSTTLNRHVRRGGAIYTTGRVVRVEADRPVPVQVDGEAAGHTPVDLRLMPGRLKFIVRMGE